MIASSLILLVLGIGGDLWLGPRSSAWAFSCTASDHRHRRSCAPCGRRDVRAGQASLILQRGVLG
jgi:hypothetical protein